MIKLPKGVVHSLNTARSQAMSLLQKEPSRLGPTGRARTARKKDADYRKKSDERNSKSSKSEGGRKTRRHKKRIA